MLQLALLRSLATAFTVAAAAAAGSAEVYPARPVHVVVPYAAGGATDLVARTLTRALAKDTDQAFVIENRPGAGSTLAATRVATSAADGYTLLFCGSSVLVMAPHLYPKLGFDPLTSFATIGRVASSAYVLMVRSDSGIATYEQLVARGQAEPRRLNYGSPGVGSGLHLTIELMLEGSRFQAQHVPFAGIAPAWNALLGGSIDFLIDSPSGALQQIQAGKARALVVTSTERIPEMPTVPTLREKGLRDFESMAWFVLLAPKATPEPVVQRLRRSLQSALHDPETVAGLRSTGFSPIEEDATAYESLVRREHARWGALIATHGITLDR